VRVTQTRASHCVHDESYTLSVQMRERFEKILGHGTSLHLFLEVVAMCRELFKVAPPSLLPQCYFSAANAMLGLHKLDEAEELLHEGLPVCAREGQYYTYVSPLSAKCLSAWISLTSLVSPCAPSS
jgi:hypothetical protein